MRAWPEVRVGLVGAGYVSAHHIRALQTLPAARIVGIADVSVARARALARRFAIPAAFESLSAMREARPEVIHILTPPASHAPLAIDAFAMGCDVLVEKPMAPTAADCDAMIAAAHRAGRRLSVNHSAIEDPAVVRALELIRRGTLGDVLAVDFHRTSDYLPYAGGPLPDSFRLGGYPFLDIGIHALSLMEAFLGRIRHLDARYRSTGTDPHVWFDEWRGTASCERGDGAFFLSWSARPIRNEIFVHGTRGDLHVDCFLQSCQVTRSLPGPKPVTAGVSALARAARTMWHVPNTTWRLATGALTPSPGIHAGVVRFHHSRANGADPPTSMDDGRRLVAWLEPFCRRADADRDATLEVDRSLEPADTLITGASGRLGRALLNRLRGGGARVRVLVRRRAPELERLPGLQVVYGELGDPAAVDRAVAGVRIVYHAGAAMRGSWPAFDASTIRGTANVVDACVAHHVERLVHVSSVTVLDYASQPPGAVVDERAPLEPRPELRGFYTRAKLAAERIVLDAVRSRMLRAVVVRPGQIVGPGYENEAPYGAMAIGDRWLVVGAGRLTLPLVHLNDVVDGLIAAASQPDVCGSIFHLVGGPSITQREYISACLATSAASPRAVYLPRIALLAAAAALAPIGYLLNRTPPLTEYRLRSINALSFDCSAARQRLGWNPAPAMRVREAHGEPSCKNATVIR
jgi:predicted dehydrogenase/nucleoside-diphosphate-sugar epimerase